MMAFGEHYKRESLAICSVSEQSLFIRVSTSIAFHLKYFWVSYDIDDCHGLLGLHDRFGGWWMVGLG